MRKLFVKKRWQGVGDTLATPINLASAVIGVAGFVFAIGALYVGGWRTIWFALSALLCAAGVVYLVVTVCHNWPPPLVASSELLDRRLDPAELKKVADDICIVGLVGNSGAGKTTLANNLLGEDWPNSRTQNVGATVVRLPRKDKNVALLDGSGEEYSQQFSVAEKADELIMLIDHNSSHNNSGLDQSRIKKHFEFADQLCRHLSAAGGKRWSILVLVNKRDLWKVGSGQISGNQIADETVTRLKACGMFRSVDCREFSNRYAKDKTKLLGTLSEWAR